MFDIIRSRITYVALAIGLIGIAVVLYAWRLPPFTSSTQMTDNAFVRGQVTVIAPQLAGYLVEVPVQDYQQVKKGDLIARLDNRIFQQKLEQASAQLAAQQAALANAEQDRHSGEARVAAGNAAVDSAKAVLDAAQSNWNRIEPLSERGVVTQANLDTARADFDKAQAAYTQARAQLVVTQQDLQSTIVNRQSLEAAVAGARAAVQLAEIDLHNTRITAPEDGRLGEVGARLGQYVSAGSQLVGLVPKRTWIVANFKETQLAGMKIGQPVNFTVDALRGARFTGHIERFSPATGSEFTVIRPDNATGNFTKVAQRLPVRISVDPDQPNAERLAPGLSVVVSIDTSAEPDPARVNQTGSAASQPTDAAAKN